MKRPLKLLSLGQHGIAHIMVPLLVVISIAIVGTYVVVASHADSAPEYVYEPASDFSCPAGYTPWSQGGGDKQNVCKLSSQAAVKKPAPIKKVAPARCTTGYIRYGSSGCVLSPRPTIQDKTRQTVADNSATSSTTAQLTSDSLSPQVAPTSSFTSLPAVVTPKPEVNIIVFTYVKGSSGNDRLGGVKVQIARSGGSEKCDNRSATTATTNSVEYSSAHILVKGTVHFLGCKAGSYTITDLGRHGYTLVSGSSQTVDLTTADQTAKIQFVLQKIPPKAKLTESP